MEFRTLKAEEIQCRINTINEKGLTILLYKDARCDMTILDETVGAMNWQRHHTRENANCIVSIWDAEKKQWIDKEDTGTESYTEAEKGLASDSFKRACTNWGIGRELYTAPFIWISGELCNLKERNGKYVCYDSFAVLEINYTEDRKISNLSIGNNTTGKVVFSTRKGVVDKPDKEKPRPEAFVCKKCGKKLMPYLDKNGKEIGVRQHAFGSEQRFGEVLCLDCIKEKQADK